MCEDWRQDSQTLRPRGHLLSLDRLDKLVLCGHSYGTFVAWHLAEQLQRCGVDVQGLVDLDPRYFLVRASEVPNVPRLLAQSLARIHFRLPLEQVACLTPLVDRGCMRANFLEATVQLAADWAHACCSYQHLNDTDHFDLKSSHAWDITNLLASRWERARGRHLPSLETKALARGLHVKPKKRG